MFRQSEAEGPRSGRVAQVAGIMTEGKGVTLLLLCFAPATPHAPRPLFSGSFLRK